MEYKNRRDQLCNNVKGLIILGAGPAVFMNKDNEYMYRQDNYFWYYTGFPDQGAVAVLDSREDGYTYHLFAKFQPEEEMVWVGKKYDENDAVNKFGADQGWTDKDLSEQLTELVKEHENFYLHCPDKECKLSELTGKMHIDFLVHKFTQIMNQQRCKKDEHELTRMRESSRISSEAIIEAMKTVKPEMMEWELDALLVYHNMRQGSRRMAYPNIVASGNNATTLHYEKNNKMMQDGELVLIDSGGEYQMFAADISRTFPVNGKFTEAQREVYETVLNVQKECINMVKPGVTIIDIHKESIRLITSGLVNLGLLEGEVDKLIEEEAYLKFYAHGIGHFLGMNVHDVWNNTTKKYPLEPGFVLTVEPGIYISKDMDVPDKYKGIGVRIEDDVLVTEEGFEVLTSLVPKEVEDIEALMN